MENYYNVEILKNINLLKWRTDVLLTMNKLVQYCVINAYYVINVMYDNCLLNYWKHVLYIVIKLVPYFGV